MRPTPLLSSVSAMMGKIFLNDSRVIISYLSCTALSRYTSWLDSWYSDGGEAFGDDKRAEALLSFAIDAPVLFLVGLPQIIEDNPVGFDDEEVVEECVVFCLARILGVMGCFELVGVNQDNPEGVVLVG
jgi:hypothetical protein